jgi:fibronectin type 3 domain-containing protein
MLNRRESILSYFVKFVYALLAVVCLSPVAGATTYYVDCNGGNDGNAGTSQSAAWRTLTPVNAKQFAAGDSILFITGCTWTGTLHPGGSGTNGNTITIDEYGTGAMPHIDGGGATAAVSLSGQQYWDINNLEVSNSASTAGLRRGVLVTTTTVSNHIHLVGLNIHNVSGQLGTDIASKNTGGIGFESSGGVGASFDDILIQNCTIAHLDESGIYLNADSGTDPRAASWAQAKWNNVVIQGNQISDIGKNAIIIRVSDAPLIQNNVINGSSTRLHGNAIYTISTANAVMQFNEVYNTALTGYTGLEDTAFDPDNDSVGTIIQYNYSHNNAGGFANPNMIPNGTAGCSGTCNGDYSDGTIIRYNISQNDVNGIISYSGAATNTQIYNNTFYIGAGLSPAIIAAHLWGNAGGWASNSTYSNNIIYNAGNGTYDLGSSTNNTFNGNIFFGNHPANEPADSKKITTNPLLQNAGSGGTGMNTLNGYQLQSGSPARGSGVAMSNNGGQDFFGTTLPTGAPDRGAAQFASTCAVPSAPANLAATAASSSQINLSWSAAAAGCSVTYNVYQSTTNGFSPSSGNQIASGVTSTSYANTGLTASTTYYYLVVAVDSAGSSAPSNQASTTTSASSGGTCSDICVNAGSTTAAGSFVADVDFSGGATINHANTIDLSGVTNPAPAAVYQTARVAATAGAGTTFSYTIPGFTAGSSQLVRLHFAETFHTGTGQRVFNVSINGTQVLANFDIFAAANAANKAVIKEFTVNADANGDYVMVFTSVVDKALISGIEVDAVSPTCTTTPSTPTGLTATAISSSAINLGWTASTAPSGCTTTYNVYRSTTSGFTPSSANQVASSLTTTAYSDTALNCGTPYYYLVVAVTSAGSSAASNQATDTTQVCTCNAAPTTPTGLSATAASTSAINLGWTASTAQSACTTITYNVYRSTTAGFTPSSANQVASGLTTTAYSDTALNCGTSYYYLVVAADAFGSSAASSQATATTQPCPCSVAPTTPTGLSATAASTTATNLGWTASTAPAGCTITYSVTRNGASAASGLTGTTFGDSGLTCSTAYTYTVVATDAFGSSAASSPATATTQACPCSAAPPTPTGLSATAASTSAINLGWTASTPPSNCTVTYSVTRNGASAASGLTGTTFGDSGLTCNTGYTYTVTAADAFGSSAASSPASATTSACTTSVQINAGGAAVAPFVADVDFTGGATINHANTINLNGQPNPAPAAVYQTAHVAATAGAGTTFSYTIPGYTAGSSHTVRLHFCETFWTAIGQRVFNVSINGTQVLANFDVFKTAGGQNRALIQSFTANANSSGQYVIVFTSVTDKALISGIEIQ